MTIRPATTDQQPMVYGATQPARLVITETVAASRTQGDGPWTTAEAILAALDREGYTVAAKTSKPREPIRALTDAEAAKYRREWDAHYAAPRASEAVRGDDSPAPDVGAAQSREGGSAAESELRCESTHPERESCCTLPAGHDTHRHVGEAWTTLDRLDGHVLVRIGDLAEVLRYVIGADTFSVVTNETLDRLFADLKEATEADQ